MCGFRELAGFVWRTPTILLRFAEKPTGDDRWVADLAIRSCAGTGRLDNRE